jgi:hypothetical protein
MLHDLRFLGRRAALGQSYSYFEALEIPRREAIRRGSDARMGRARMRRNQAMTEEA